MAWAPYAIMGGAGLGSSIFSSLTNSDAADDAAKAAEEAARLQYWGGENAAAMQSPYLQGGQAAYGALVGSAGLAFPGKAPNLADFYNQAAADLPPFPESLRNASPQEQLAWLNQVIATDPRGKERFQTVLKPFETAMDAYTRSSAGHAQGAGRQAPEFTPYQDFSYDGRVPDAPTLEMPGYAGNVPEYSAPEEFRPGARVPTEIGYEGQVPDGYRGDRFAPSTKTPEFSYDGKTPDPWTYDRFSSDSQVPDFAYGGNVPGFEYGGEGPKAFQADLYEGSGTAPPEFSYKGGLDYTDAPTGYTGGRFAYGEDGKSVPDAFSYGEKPLSYEAYTGEVPTFDPSKVMTDPGFDFRLKQGTRAIEGSAAARGNLLSGKAQKELAGFGQDLASQEYGAAYGRGLQKFEADMGTSREGYGRYLDTFDRQRGTEQEGYTRARGEYDLGTRRDDTAYARSLEQFLTNQGISRDEWATASAAEKERFTRAFEQEEQKYGRAKGEYGLATERENTLYGRGFNEFLTNYGIRKDQFDSMSAAEQEKYRRAFSEAEYGREGEATEYGRRVGEYGIGRENEATRYGRGREEFMTNLGISQAEYDSMTAAEKARFDRAMTIHQEGVRAEQTGYDRERDAWLQNQGVSRYEYESMTAAEKARYDRAYEAAKFGRESQGIQYGQDLQTYGTNYDVGRDTYATTAGIEAERRRRALEDIDTRNRTRTGQYNLNAGAEDARYGRATSTYGINYGKSRDDYNTRSGAYTDWSNRLASLAGAGQTAATQTGNYGVVAAGRAADASMYGAGVKANAATSNAANITGLVGDIAGAYAYGMGKQKPAATTEDDWYAQYMKRRGG